MTSSLGGSQNNEYNILGSIVGSRRDYQHISKSQAPSRVSCRVRQGPDNKQQLARGPQKQADQLVKMTPNIMQHPAGLIPVFWDPMQNSRSKRSHAVLGAQSMSFKAWSCEVCPGEIYRGRLPGGTQEDWPIQHSLNINQSLPTSSGDFLAS